MARYFKWDDATTVNESDLIGGVSAEVSPMTRVSIILEALTARPIDLNS